MFGSKILFFHPLKLETSRYELFPLEHFLEALFKGRGGLFHFLNANLAIFGSYVSLHDAIFKISYLLP